MKKVIDGREITYNDTHLNEGTGVYRAHIAIQERFDPKTGRSLVPSMKAINKKPKDFSAISFFAGCGGASVGMKMAGFDVLYANEFIPSAQDTYRLNHGHTIVDPSDIRDIDPKAVMKQLGIKRGQLDHLDMSPPCFLAGTPITTDSETQAIQNVQIGTNVLTHTGQYHRVYDTSMRHYDGEIVKIECDNGHLIVTTLEHPLYMTTRLSDGSFPEPAWIEAVYAHSFGCYLIYVEDGQHVTTRVRHVSFEDYVGPVYNISVETDESYVASGFVVHNCKGFSSAGVRDKGWNKEVEYSDGVKQRVDDLFDQGVRMLTAFQPKTFLAENVSGFVKGISRGLFAEALQDFRDAGYVVKAAVIDPVKLGIPQTRTRTIFIGVRKDLNIEPKFPVPTKKRVTVRDILPHVLYIKRAGSVLEYVPSDYPSPTIVASDFHTGENARFSCGGWIEDDQGRRRKYTLHELRRVMCFPQDFLLAGKPTQQWERLGRSHLPLQVYYLMKALRENVLQPYYDSKGADYTSKIR